MNNKTKVMGIPGISDARYEQIRRNFNQADSTDSNFKKAADRLLPRWDIKGRQLGR